MPRKGGRRRKTQRGMGLGSDIIKGLKKANDWARKTKVISKVAGTLSSVGVPYAGQIAGTAKQWGYGYDPTHAAAVKHAMR